jgi:hypothetical protein
MSLSSKTLTLGVLMMLGAVTSSEAPAHHSFAMFDNGTCRDITGTVRTFQWSFPHSWIWINVPNPKGGIDTWGFEGEPPSNLAQDGWTKTSLKKGEKITVRFSPLKDGRNGGAFSVVTLADGRQLVSERGRNDVCAKLRVPDRKP